MNMSFRYSSRSIGAPCKDCHAFEGHTEGRCSQCHEKHFHRLAHQQRENDRVLAIDRTRSYVARWNGRVPELRIVTTGILHINRNYPDNIYWWAENIAMLTTFIATQLSSQGVNILDITHYDGRENPFNADGHVPSIVSFDEETDNMVAVVPTIVGQYGHIVVKKNVLLNELEGHVLLLDFANAFYQVGGDLSSVKQDVRRIAVGYDNWAHYFNNLSHVNVVVDDKTQIDFKIFSQDK